MRIIDNVNDVLGEDLETERVPGSKLRMAASVFSIYAFEALKDELGLAATRKRRDLGLVGMATPIGPCPLSPSAPGIRRCGTCPSRPREHLAGLAPLRDHGRQALEVLGAGARCL